MAQLRGRPRWQYIVVAIIALLLVFWFITGSGSGSGSGGQGSDPAIPALSVGVANAADNPEEDLALVTGDAVTDNGTGLDEGAPLSLSDFCAGLNGWECENLFDNSFYVSDPGPQPDPVQPEPGTGPTTGPPTYSSGNPCAGLTGLECETLFDDSYYAPGSPYDLAPPPPSGDGGGDGGGGGDDGGGSSGDDGYSPPPAPPADERDYCLELWAFNGWDYGC